jgi:NAD(P)-dependent dehydrogenase (short-subunit alcohol dehydrogenase family)
MQTLNGQVAIISGGLGDIGRAIADELAKRGADIALGDVRSTEHATETLAQLQQLGRRARYDQVDVSDAAAVAAWVRTVEDDFGVPTLIIPNAAVVTLKGIQRCQAEEWQRELNINLSGAFYMAQAAALRLVEQNAKAALCLRAVGPHTRHIRIFRVFGGQSRFAHVVQMHGARSRTARYSGQRSRARLC